MRECAREDGLVVTGEERFGEQDDVGTGSGALCDEVRGASDVVFDGAGDGLGLNGGDTNGHGNSLAGGRCALSSASRSG